VVSWWKAAVTAAMGIVLVAIPGAGAFADDGADGGSGCPLPVFGPGSAYHPAIDPEAFSTRVTNPMFPLRPGRTLVYAGVKDGEVAKDVVRVTGQTLVMDGVRTRIVQDRLFLSGKLAERTRDYFAQDRCGNVWYFGEDTAELDETGRVVSTDGSFHAGEQGAQPGVVMQAHPQLRRQFRQEWLPGQAEDTFMAVSRSASVTTPYRSFQHALRTRETTALEPGVIDEKLYARGIGEVVEVTAKGPQEKLVLVDVRP